MSSCKVKEDVELYPWTFQCCMRYGAMLVSSQVVPYYGISFLFQKSYEVMLSKKKLGCMYSLYSDATVHAHQFNTIYVYDYTHILNYSIIQLF